jgi:hypothetical protein
MYASVVETVDHPDYDEGTRAYDFRVLKLSGWVSKSCLAWNHHAIQC